jgi:hypothetical protein
MSWIKTVPQEEGSFHISSRDGDYAGVRDVILHKGEYKGVQGISLSSGVPWKGWWWSVPIVEPPRPPEW